MQPSANHSVVKRYGKSSCICTYNKQGPVKIRQKPGTEKDKQHSFYLTASKR